MRWFTNVGRRSPLFLQIFVSMCGAILVAQILNVLLIVSSGVPTPKIVSLDEVAATFTAGAHQGDGMELAFAEPPSESAQDSRDRVIAARLALKLGVPAAAVRVAIARPPSFFDYRSLVHSREPAKNETGKAPRNLDLIVGGFTAALRLPDGRWETVQPRSHLIEPWLAQLISWFCGALFATAPFSWMVARRVAAPIRALASAAERIGRDPNAPAADLDGSAEVAMASSALNEMQTRLKRYVEDRTTMVAAIAHDLRTPLMRLALYLDEVPEHVRIAAEAEILEMRNRIQATLDFVQGVSKPSRRRSLNLRSLTESVVDGMSDLGADVAIECAEDVTVHVDVAALKALLTNLLENATRYAGDARVSLHRRDGVAVVEIVDRGPGIPENELERVFAPFYRLEPSRNRSGGGAGLGLASARAVARAHGGDVTLSNREGGGLLARLTIPG